MSFGELLPDGGSFFVFGTRGKTTILKSGMSFVPSDLIIVVLRKLPVDFPA